MSPGISTRLLATQSDERLLALVRQGHERAFEALVHRYRKPLLNYCRRLPLSESRAEDVLQQALLKTWIALRGGAEVRDLKAWLYRVVHNTAVNAVRDAARDPEGIADPTLRAGAGQADLERGLMLREALAEVAALPRLQREVVVRTAVGGYSHEQVASDLGITDGAVRGLLYRARATLRTAVTALTPPPLLTWLGGRVEQSGPAPERLGELAAGGGAAAGLGGLLAKSGVAILAVGTLITGAAVHIQGAAHRHAPVKVAAVSGATTQGVAGGSSGGSSQAVPSATISSHTARGQGRPRGRGRDERLRAASAGPGSALTTASGGRGSDRSTSGGDEGHAVGPASAPTSAGTTAPSGSIQSVGSTQGASSGQAEGAAGQGGSSSAPSSPSGSAASSGSGAGGSSAPSSGDSAEAPPAGDESSGGSDPSGSSPSGSSPSGSSPSGSSEAGGSQGTGGGGSGSSGSEQSGGVVGTVVHEVASLVEHLLH